VLLSASRRTMGGKMRAGVLVAKGVRLPQLHRLREERLLTQQQLAEKAEVARSTVARVELGEPARYSTVKALAEALGVTPADLMRPPPE
jgi:transcriptional regulator with XRE-family HTH domain